MSESNVPKLGPVAPAHERGAAEIDDAMSRVRALPSTSADAEGQLPEVDLDEQIETLGAAHDTLRRQLSSIDR